MAHTSKDGLLALIRDGKPMTLRQQLLLKQSDTFGAPPGPSYYLFPLCIIFSSFGGF